MQNNNIDCPFHPENPALYICLEEQYKSKRIFCHSCFQNKDNLFNQTKLEQINQLPQILENARFDCDDLLQFLEETFQEIFQYKQYLIQAIRMKYHIQQEYFIEMNIDSKCQVIDNLVKFKEVSKIIQQQMSIPFKSFLADIKDVLKDVHLEEVTYLQQRNEQEIQQFTNILNQSEELFNNNLYNQALDTVNRALIINPRSSDAINIKGNILK